MDNNANTYIPLWKSTAPGSKGSGSTLPNQHTPTLQYFPSKFPNSPKALTAIIVCPGGAYRVLASYEEVDPCIWLASLGYSAYALRYRLGDIYKFPTQQVDLNRAIDYVTSLDQYKRFGVMGFSAGGHLACFAKVLYYNAPEHAF